MKKCFFAVSALVVALFVGCQSDFTQDLPEGVTVFEVELPGGESRTELGAKEGDTYPIYWSEGDRIVVNGVQSKPVEIKENRKSASYEVEAVLNAPYRVTYPYTSATSAEKPMVDFPALQNYKEGSFDMGAAPMCGYISGGSSLTLKHLAGVLCFSLRGADDNMTLKSITITSEEALSGAFAVNCENATIEKSNESLKSVTFNIEGGLKLSTSSDKKVYITLPYGNRGVCHLTCNYNTNKRYLARFNGANIKAGFVHAFPTLTIKESSVETNLDEMYEVEVPDWNFGENATIFEGYVTCSDDATPIPNVVISDGFTCTKTDKNGKYCLISTAQDVKFVMASIPSGYSAPTTNNLPVFYKYFSRLKEKDGKYSANFTFHKISGNANRFSLLIAADPQPRPSDYEFDNNAYHSLDCCDDLYRDMREKAATITDREVYGLMLGDIVHESMPLFENYVEGVSTLGFPMFNVLGNHDNDPSATNDVEGRHKFEQYLGPTYYSFNIGNVHFVVLDNLIMELNDEGRLTNASKQGLTDEIMEWLRQDLSYVDKSKILMVAAHSPMTKLRTGGSRTNAAQHFADYTSLFAEFAQAHIWSGHTHKSFNYNYPNSSSLYPIEEHTVARSTGELWTNEYEVGGTPRGYVVVNVDGNNVSWKFKPTIYQTGSFVSTYYYTPYKPNYTHRDWNYNSSGIAKMKSDGSTLSDSYQMKVYAPGTYHDTFADKLAGVAANDYIYVDVFMWDNKWQVPTFNGQEMEHLAYNTAYSLAEYEIINHYYKYGYSLKDYASYKYNYGKEVYVHTIFRIKAPSATGSGTVSVVDRFGNTYSSSISW